MTTSLGARRAVRLRTIIALVVIGTATAQVAAAGDRVADAVQAMQDAAAGALVTTRSPVTGLVSFVNVEGDRSIGAAANASGSATERALAFVDTYGAAFALAGRAEVSVASVSGIDEVGQEHIRLRQLHRGVPVTGGEITVHVARDGVRAVLAKTVAVPADLAVTPRVSAEEALTNVRELLAKHLGVHDAELSTPRLEILNRAILDRATYPVRLAWFVEARGPELREYVWIDAQTGGRLHQWSQLEHARNRKVYTASSGSTLPGALVRSEGQPASGDADVDAAYDYSGSAYDYFLANHGRDGYDGAGAAIVSSVHVCPIGKPCPWSDSFWNGTQATYGEGFSQADDVVAHEYAHAIIDHTANLFAYMQSGAIAESFADIFGETVDLSNGAGTDTAGVRWVIGEDLPDLGALRDMADPQSLDDPAKMSDPEFDCGFPGNDAGGIHTNALVPDHAYQLLVDGGTFNGVTVTGIGLAKAAAIEYRALTRYLVSGSDFLDLANALAQSCSDLVGTGGITAGDCAQVANATNAVEMRNAWPCDPPQPTPPSHCPPGHFLNQVWYETFDRPYLAQWAASTLRTGPSAWLAGGNVYDDSFATSGTNNLWGSDPKSISDSVATMVGTVHLPVIARMQFNHSFGFESYLDGGVVEFSTDGGTTWFDAMQFYTLGANYNGTIPTEFGNPLANPNPRNAFVKESWGYTATQLDLGPLANLDVKFRFRIGSDSSVGDVGWFVDDLRIYQCISGTDVDGDLIVDSSDNCPTYYNPMQIDTDGDGLGNGCDPSDCGSTIASASGADRPFSRAAPLAPLVAVAAALARLRRRERGRPRGATR